MAAFKIREFTPADYPAIVWITNAVYREYPETVEELRFQDERRDRTRFWERWMLEADGGAVGVGNCSHHNHMFHPRKFGIHCMVHPELQARGLGAALYRHLLSRLEPFEPISLRTHARDDWDRSRRFLAARGFVEDKRDWESRLDLAAFDEAPFAGAVERVLEQGIEIRSLAELRGDPEQLRKLYELDTEICEDVPRPEPVYTPDSFDLWAERMTANPNLMPEGYFLALDSGEYVGLSQLWNSQSGGEFYTGLTGVKRSHRRRGIALALKLRGIAWARQQGVARLKTWNESGNRPMLAINEALGFVKQPAWIDYVNRLRSE